jgi:hypothetical protein
MPAPHPTSITNLPTANVSSQISLKKHSAISLMPMNYRSRTAGSTQLWGVLLALSSDLSSLISLVRSVDLSPEIG